MRLDRNQGSSRRGKYALLKLRDMPADDKIDSALTVLEQAGVLDWGAVQTESEFFVIRLRDLYAHDALSAYATAAAFDHNDEWADEVRELASRAGHCSPFCKRPD